MIRREPGTALALTVTAAWPHYRVVQSRAQIIDRLVNPGVIAVLRLSDGRDIVPVAEALVEGGVIAIEVTMTTPHALEGIRAAKQAVGDRGLVGVGTVLNPETARSAIEAGAEFVVSPIMRPEICVAAHTWDKPVMLGAYTPTEAQAAHEAGSDFIKIFPADSLGPAYIRALRAPLPHLRIVPTGGVDVKTIGEFFIAGCAAVGAGSSLLRRDALQRRDWAAITGLARSFVEAAQAGRAACLS